MLISYSKLVLTGMIAVSCGLMGCQKKGNARNSVKPTGVEKTTQGGGNAEVNTNGTDVAAQQAEAERLKKAEQEKIAEQERIAQEQAAKAKAEADKAKADAEKEKETTAAPVGKDDKKEETKTEDKKAKDEKAKTTSVAKEKEDKKADEKKTEDEKAKKEQETKAKEEADKAKKEQEIKAEQEKLAKAKEEADKNEKAKTAEVKACSAEVMAAGSDLKKKSDELKAKILDTNDKTSQADRIKEINAVLDLCTAWEKSFDNEKIEQCSVAQNDKKINMNKASWSTGTCFILGDYLKSLENKDNTYSKAADQYYQEVETRLKALEFIVSDASAKRLFSKDNKDWKTFLVEGKINESSRELMSLLDVQPADKKKVACTVTTMGDIEYNENTVLKMKIKSIKDLQTENTQDLVQKGIDMALELTAVSKDAVTDAKATGKTAQATMSCVHLKADRLSWTGLRTAFGKEIVPFVRKIK